jgi:hypothetical protein
MIIALAVMVIALIVASLLVGVYALYTAQKLFYRTRKTVDAVRAECAEAIDAAQSQFDVLAMEIKNAKSQTPIEIIPGTPKPGMNVTRRSHALRLHRTGSSPTQIAAALEIPSQEVDLLVKVHEILLNRL